MEQKMPKKSRKQAKKNQYLKYNITIKYALSNEITFVFCRTGTKPKREKKNISKSFNISLKHNGQKKILEKKKYPKT